MAILLITVTVWQLTSVFTAIESMKYEDSNGPDDNSLYYITQDELRTGKERFATYLSSGRGQGGQTNVEPLYAGDDYDCVVTRHKRIDGICVLQTTRTDNPVLQLDVTTTLTSGNAEIIITIDGEYHSHVPLNTTQTIILEDIAGKLVMVRGGFESAQFEIDLTRSFPTK